RCACTRPWSELPATASRVAKSWEKLYRKTAKNERFINGLGIFQGRLLSCHPENWMDVGAHVVQLDRIMAVTPNGNVANAAVDPIDAAYFDGRQHIQAS
ncbi:MAG: hypothetical protein P3W97_005505, partial [Tepidimonas sp.]|uniref:hypothetical protein n=1 Tax=Tepidimonas sp. TaxID=2002775 RepID=UPI00259EC0BB